MSLISIVVPCYNEQEALPIFVRAIQKLSTQIYGHQFEFIFVDDGSRDETLGILRALSKKEEKIKYISFSRNFGKESAIFAGLEKTKGEYIAVMDADMQDPPELLEEMLSILETGEFDCVATRRTTRDGEPPIRSFFAKAFYKLINVISDTEITDGARDFRLMTRQMVNAVLSMKEYNRFSKGIFEWVGFRTKWIPYVNINRVAGETKWSFWKLFLYSLEGIVAFSTAPLALASILGLLFCFIAFAFIIVVVIRTLIWGDPVGGWPSMVCLISLMGGVQLFTIGILGQYLAKTYLEVKNRPLYIIKETETSMNNCN